MAQISDFSQNVDKFTSTIQPRRQALQTGQKGEEQDYLSRFRQAISGQEAVPHMYERLGAQFNLPSLQQAANTLTTTLANIPATYGAATRGFDVNANQLARIIGEKSAELSPTVTAATNALKSAQEQVATQMGYEQAQQAKELTPFATEQDFLKDRFARESTGFTQDNEMELNAYLQKMNAGVTLSEGEANRANQLAIAKLNYDAEIKKIEAQAKYAAMPATSAGLYNVQTGQRVGWG